MKPSLVIFEGPDGIGKSTQAEMFAKRWDAKLICQPSNDNIVSFIRAEAKKNPKFTPFERQLLIAQSHTVDAFTKFPGDHNIVMDRSLLSGFVYGEITNVEAPDLALLQIILERVYQHNVAGKYHVTIAFLKANKSLKVKDEGDVFEAVEWGRLASLYQNQYQVLQNQRLDGKFLLDPEERVVEIDVSGLDRTGAFTLINQTVQV